MTYNLFLNFKLSKLTIIW